MRLMKQYINHGGYFNPSFDFRNMAPGYSEIPLLIGKILRNDSLALMINCLFPLLLTLGIFEFFYIVGRIPIGFSWFLAYYFCLNTCF